MTATATYAKGLEGVIATDTAISLIDGQAGRLFYRGMAIDELADHATFEEATYYLLFGALPQRAELDDFTRKLRRAYAVPQPALDLIAEFPRDADPMALLRSAVSVLGLHDATANDNTREANTDIALRLIGGMGTLCAAIARARAGKAFVSPNPDLGVAANYLYMLSGKQPAADLAKVFDVCLILHADHGMNASTFTARVVSSTLTDLYSAVTAAIGSLKGPLHGGANRTAIQLLKDIGSVKKVEAFLEKFEDKVPGFGHRVYKAYDPRAIILCRYSERLSKAQGDASLYQIARQVEKVVVAKLGSKGIYPNVDFYSGTIYEIMGIDPDLFTTIFALSRVSGWCAHILEQLADNRIYRPRAEYTGPTDVHYVAIDRR